jgi:hypothetical protein
MAHTPSDVRELFDRECEFPAERDDVVAAVGDERIRAPNGDSITVEAVLERSDTTTFPSAIALHNTVMANLGDEHVGRQNYDDRSSNPERDTDLSF